MAINSSIRPSKRGVGDRRGTRNFDPARDLSGRRKHPRRARRFFRNFLWNAGAKLKLAAVTGTNGKTTTTFLIKHICEKPGCAADCSAPFVRNRRARFAGDSHHARIARFTGAARANRQRRCKAPPRWKSLRTRWRRSAHGIEWDVAVFTNLTQDHLDFHGTMENYFEAKAKLFGKIPVVTYGHGMHADFRASNYRTEFAGTSYQLDAQGRSYLVRVPLIGRFNVANSMAALAAATVMGVSLRSAILSLARSPQVPGRLELVPAKRQFQIFVDYAHTDDALRNVLKTLRELKPRKLIVVFGCGGDRDRKKRPLMGRVADELADYAIITSDNPRKENPDAIISEVEKGFRSTHYEKIVERAEAIRRAVAMAQPRDLVLIAGKGHEKYQEFADHTIPFDDLQVARRALDDLPVQFSI
jgi:UDP-N-acetylmuramoyl-L-alanyl-D-glutamate--2,6-diaminopimelate ligase